MAYRNKSKEESRHIVEEIANLHHLPNLKKTDNRVYGKGNSIRLLDNSLDQIKQRLAALSDIEFKDAQIYSMKGESMINISAYVVTGLIIDGHKVSSLDRPWLEVIDPFLESHSFLRLEQVVLLKMETGEIPWICATSARCGEKSKYLLRILLII